MIEYNSDKPWTEEEKSHVYWRDKLLDLMGEFNAKNEGQSAYTLADLFKLEFGCEFFLLDALLPSDGLFGIVGKPDSGKSMMARELGLRIAMGMAEFMGHSLKPKHKRALYVVTEDGLRSSKEVLSKQYYSLMNEKLRERQQMKIDHPEAELPEFDPIGCLYNFAVVPASELTSKELLELLEIKHEEAPYDVVVIDAIADVMSERDSNSNSAVRDGLKPFATFAEKHKCAVGFIGHIKKSAYNTSPDQEHVAGAAAHAQKARVIFDLRADPKQPNVRYLVVTKGNAIAAEQKSIARKLYWNPETFLTEFHGEIIPRDMIGCESGPAKKPIEWSKYIKPGEQLKAAEIIKRIGDEVGLKDRGLRLRMDAELVRIDNRYQLPGGPKEHSTLFEEPDVEAISPYMYD